jgi:hypothetical protein
MFDAEYKYDKNEGGPVSLNDHVVTCHLPVGQELLGKTGTIAGGVDSYIAIVILDTPMVNGARAICMPVVCLKLN